MEQASRFAVTTVAVFAAAIVLNLAAYAMALDLPNKRSLGMCSMNKQRIALANAAPQPKLLLVGGSGTTQGINAQAMSAALGIRTQNFGLHGAYSADYQLFLARKALQSGDTVLLNLEYSAYSMDKPTDIAIDVFANCSRDYLSRISPSERLEIAIGFPVAALWSRLVFAIAPSKPRNLPHYTEWGDPLPSHHPLLSKAELRRAGLYRPFPIVFDPNAAAAREISEFVGWAYRNRVAVISTWPNTLGFDSYRTMPAFADIRRFYEKLGVPVVGEPDLGMVRAEHLSDTPYHLNETGIRIRTARLADALAQRPELIAPLRSHESTQSRGE